MATQLPKNLTASGITWPTRGGAAVHAADRRFTSFRTWWCDGCDTEGTDYVAMKRADLSAAAQAHADGCSARRS
ncbi:hypothetical protein [Actinacidiphila yeochonensis]|uniref:hypothetical protein n=1 Tax=Actinacidiphila yeochonensis TaxID=89050 RepID=UPI0005654618|nr:hypothetical protein [Actinacidiphila yeochonensis]